MPFDVSFGPPQNTVTNIIPARYEIDLSGSGGALSDGTVSIGGYDWSVTGIGASSTQVEIRINLADIYSDYDGDVHAVEVCTEEYASSTNTEQQAYQWITRQATTGAYNRCMRYNYAGQQTYGSWLRVTGTSTERYQTSLGSNIAVRRRALRASPTHSSAAFSTVALSAGTPYRISSIDRNYYSYTRFENYSGTAQFTTTDFLRIGISRTAASAASIEQNANGLLFTSNTTTMSLARLYIYFSVPDVS